METKSDFQIKVEETSARDLWSIWKFRRSRLLEYYDYFANYHNNLGDAGGRVRQILRTAEQRLDAIQRELDRRSQRMSTLVGFAALIVSLVPILFGLAQCQSNKLPARLPMKLSSERQSTPR